MNIPILSYFFSVIIFLLDYSLFLLLRVYDIKFGTYSFSMFGNISSYIIAKNLPDTYFPFMVLMHSRYYMSRRKNLPTTRKEYPHPAICLAHCIVMGIELYYRYSINLLIHEPTYVLTCLMIYLVLSMTGEASTSGVFRQLWSFVGKMLFYIECQNIILKYLRDSDQYFDDKYETMDNRLIPFFISYTLLSK